MSDVHKTHKVRNDDDDTLFCYVCGSTRKELLAPCEETLPQYAPDFNESEYEYYE